MFDQLMRMLKAPEPQSRPDVRLSVAVLLLEAARQDDSFDSAERAVIAQLLTRKFDLSSDECAVLLEAGAKCAPPRWCNCMAIPARFSSR